MWHLEPHCLNNGCDAVVHLVTALVQSATALKNTEVRRRSRLENCLAMQVKLRSSDSLLTASLDESFLDVTRPVTIEREWMLVFVE